MSLSVLIEAVMSKRRFVRLRKKYDIVLFLMYLYLFSATLRLCFDGAKTEFIIFSILTFAVTIEDYMTVEFYYVTSYKSFKILHFCLLILTLIYVIYAYITKQPFFTAVFLIMLMHNGHIFAFDANYKDYVKEDKNEK